MLRPRLIPVLAACLGGLAQAAGAAQPAKASDVETLLSYKPTQRWVDYDSISDPAAIKTCTIDDVLNAKGKKIGFVLRDGQGRPLRKVVDVAGNDNRMDQWSYFVDGFEVYRENDFDGNRSVDECRWMNSGGTRIATVLKGKINGWKQISAEEASKVLTQAIVDRDLALLETVVATPEELLSLGLSKAEVEKAGVAADLPKHQAKLDALWSSLKGWDEKTVWLRFDGAMPHLIPAEPEGGLKADVVLYENGVIFAGLPNGQGDPTATSFLQTTDLVKIGANWKFLGLPKASDPKKPMLVSTQDAGIRSALRTW